MFNRSTKEKIKIKKSVGKNTLYLGDCLIESDKIESGTVDLILTDLPYGTVKDMKYPNDNRKGYDTTAKWDTTIDTNEIYKIANRILRKNGKMILFAQQPFTNELINKAIPNLPFNYSMIWEKDNFANALFVNKACVSYYEDILLFSKNNETVLKHPLRNYAKNIVDYIGLKQIEIQSKIETGKIHFLGAEKSTQFSLLQSKVYDKLIEVFGIDKMQGFKEFAELKEIDSQFKSKFASTFNLWEGNKYKSNILKYKKEYRGQHPTQKPVLLIEDLIKTFSNENDLVVDLTMGSGSTGVACKNTNRNFIGIEKDEKYFNIAQNRINGTEFKSNGFEKNEERGLFLF